MRYRRAYIPGGSFFFTLVTEHRRPLFQTQVNVEVLRQAFHAVKRKRPFEIDAIVILPDHIHCIWTLPPDDTGFDVRWRLIKTWFTKHCVRSCAPSPIRPGRQGVSKPCGSTAIGNMR